MQPPEQIVIDDCDNISSLYARCFPVTDHDGPRCFIAKPAFKFPAPSDFKRGRAYDQARLDYGKIIEEPGGLYAFPKAHFICQKRSSSRSKKFNPNALEWEILQAIGRRDFDIAIDLALNAVLRSIRRQRDGVNLTAVTRDNLLLCSPQAFS